MTRETTTESVRTADARCLVAPAFKVDDRGSVFCVGCRRFGHGGVVKYTADRASLRVVIGNRRCAACGRGWLDFPNVNVPIGGVVVSRDPEAMRS